MIAAVSRVFAPELRRPTAATSPFTWLALVVYLAFAMYQADTMLNAFVR